MILCVFFWLDPQDRGPSAGLTNQDVIGWGLDGHLVMGVGGVIPVVLSFWLDPKGPKDQD